MTAPSVRLDALLDRVRDVVRDNLIFVHVRHHQNVAFGYEGQIRRPRSELP